VLLLLLLAFTLMCSFSSLQQLQLLLLSRKLWLQHSLQPLPAQIPIALPCV
jgi:hypothetical protein